MAETTQETTAAPPAGPAESAGESFAAMLDESLGNVERLEGTVLETVVSPEAGAVRSILRFDRRLHVATDDGVFRYRHGHFEQIEVEETTELEPETEPIASLQ